MANVKISALTADTAPTADDLVVTVNDPGGTPATKKATITSLTKAIPAVIGDSGSGGTKGLVPAPAAGDTAAGKFLKADGTWVAPTGGSGGLGDVVGPSSAVDERVAVFDGTTGKLIKDGGSTIADIIAAGGAGTFAGGEFEKFKYMSGQVSPNTTTVVATGHTGAWSPLAGGASSNQDDADGTWARRTTGATINNQAGENANVATLVSMIPGTQVAIKMRTHSNIAAIRLWTGLSSSDVAGSDDPVTNGLMFRYATDSDGTAFWRTYSNDGSSTGTVTTTTQSIVVSTVYILLIKIVSTSSVEFYISTNNGDTFTLVATHTTDLPAAGSRMNFYCKLATLEAVDKGVYFSWVQIRTR